MSGCNKQNLIFFSELYKNKDYLIPILKFGIQISITLIN